MTSTEELAAAVDAAVAARFRAIKPTLTEKRGDYCYDGYRTSPEELGWRFRQNMCIKSRDIHTWQPHETMPVEIAAGKYDKEIEATWHSAAGASYFYQFEKDWGHPDDVEPAEDFYDDIEEDLY